MPHPIVKVLALVVLALLMPSSGARADALTQDEIRAIVPNALFAVRIDFEQLRTAAADFHVDRAFASRLAELTGLSESEASELVAGLDTLWASGASPDTPVLVARGRGGFASALQTRLRATEIGQVYRLPSSRNSIAFLADGTVVVGRERAARTMVDRLRAERTGRAPVPLGAALARSPRGASIRAAIVVTPSVRANLDIDLLREARTISGELTLRNGGLHLRTWVECADAAAATAGSRRIDTELGELARSSQVRALGLDALARAIRTSAQGAVLRVEARVGQGDVVRLATLGASLLETGLPGFGTGTPGR